MRVRDLFNIYLVPVARKATEDASATLTSSSGLTAQKQQQIKLFCHKIKKKSIPTFNLYATGLSGGLPGALGSVEKSHVAILIGGECSGGGMRGSGD